MAGHKYDDKDEKRFRRFFDALDSKIAKYEKDAEDAKVILTLKYYLDQGMGGIQEGYVTDGLSAEKKNLDQYMDAKQRGYEKEESSFAERLNKSCSVPWWRLEGGMKEDYKEFDRAVLENDVQTVEALKNKGLNISRKFKIEVTPIEFARCKNFTQMEEVLK